MLEALSASDEYGIILRAKGMLPAEDGTWIYFDMVPEETEIREGAPEYTGRLCVIGSKLKEDKTCRIIWACIMIMRKQRFYGNCLKILHLDSAHRSMKSCV